MPFASALSEHPVPATAVGEAAGQVLERIGPGPDLALVFVTRPHAGALEDAAGAVAEILRPGVLVGCAAESVAGTGREVERTPAISLWAGRFGPSVPVELEMGGPGQAAQGWPSELDFEPGALVLVADPFSFPAEAFFEWLACTYPGLPVIGGMASGASGPGGTRLVVSGAGETGPGRGPHLRTAGAVGALLGPGVRVQSVVSQGCRPIGRPMVVTRADGHVVTELAGRPPLEQLSALARGALDQDDLELVNRGALQLGRVIDEYQVEPGIGDFRIVGIMGGDPRSGAVALTEAVETGTTVQFHLRDAEAADHELRQLLAGRGAAAALLFTCNGRGTRLFPAPHHDASVLAELLGHVPTGGFFAAGELGPVSGRNFLHSFTASIALLSEEPGPAAPSSPGEEGGAGPQACPPLGPGVDHDSG